MSKTKIEWTDFTINPIRATRKDTGAVGHYCQKLSPGCANCFASRWQPRFGLPPFQEQVKHKRDDNIEIFLDEAVLQQVLRRKKPTRFFWCDMTDMFGEWVPDEYLDICFAVMLLTPQHTHQVLTKRPDRMREYFKRLAREDQCLDGIGVLHAAAAPVLGDTVSDEQWEEVLHSDLMPLPNVCLGVSVENQDTANERIPLLLETPAAKRFLSVEPLLNPVDLTLDGLCCEPCSFCEQFGYTEWDTGAYVCTHCDSSGKGDDFAIDWVIAGGESGPKARPMNPEHLRALRDQCVAAGVPFFFKQWGEWLPVVLEDEGATLYVVPDDGGDEFRLEGMGRRPLHYFSNQVMCRVGKKKAGRVLDGRTWDEWPA